MEPKEVINESLPQPEKAGNVVEDGSETLPSVENAPSRQKPVSLPQAPQNIPGANPIQLPSTTDDTNNAKKAVTVKAQPKEEKVDDKQWVERAKQIVNQTKDDPFKQKNEVSKIKAGYIKQKFNKVVRTDTGTA